MRREAEKDGQIIHCLKQMSVRQRRKRSVLRFLFVFSNGNLKITFIFNFPLSTFNTPFIQEKFVHTVF